MLFTPSTLAPWHPGFFSILLRPGKSVGAAWRRDCMYGDGAGSASEDHGLSRVEHGDPAAALQRLDDWEVRWQPHLVGANSLRIVHHIGVALIEALMITDDARAVDRFAAPVHRDADAGGRELPQRVFTPIEPGQHSRAGTVLAEERGRSAVRDPWTADDEHAQAREPAHQVSRKN